MTAASAIIERLNRLLFELHGKQVVAGLTTDELKRFYRIAKSMGAKDEDFAQHELETMVAIAAPERLSEVRFRNLPPATHTPLNCPVLRDWAFGSTKGDTLPKVVLSIGKSPFIPDDFKDFVSQRGLLYIDLGDGHTEDSFEAFQSASKPIRLTVPFFECFVIGREDWDEDKLDDLIDFYRGQHLRVYSQEMFVSFLLTGADPFAASSDVLAAFRAGHPALEFLSQGWPGWVKTFVPIDEHHQSSRHSATIGNMEAESPLHAMGYKVGKLGRPSAERQAILYAAFVDVIPKVGGAAYMDEWGQPQSAKRLKKIANLLASNCRNMKKRNANASEAIDDWEDDLRWLKETLYHGRFTFAWPDSFVR